MLNQQPHSRQRVLVAKTYNIQCIEGDVIRKNKLFEFFLGQLGAMSWLQKGKPKQKV